MNNGEITKKITDKSYLIFLGSVVAIIVIIWTYTQKYGYASSQSQLNFIELVQSNTGNSSAAFMVAGLLFVVAVLSTRELHKSRENAEN